MRATARPILIRNRRRSGSRLTADVLTAALLIAAALLVRRPSFAQAPRPAKTAEQESDLAAALARLDTKVLSPEYAPDPEHDLGRYVQARLTEANRSSTAEWKKIGSQAEWEKIRAAKLLALRKALGGPLAADNWPTKREPPKFVVAGEIAGDGFRIQNVVFESRPGVWVTANLYRPLSPLAHPPGIVISSAHHTPKWNGELQDMGMTWARAGCLVLVPDHLGHGERRQHPFATATDFSGKFPVDRQDYHFRFDSGFQLQLAGETLTGFMAYDLIRGFDTLLVEGADPKRLILLGGVAGGGDPAAVAAALDERIACAAIFNFGGPQPESRYPLPENVEDRFGYAGSGSWESTRNLRRSAADGFLPWVIVGGIAPRKLIYSHEFSWDREHDPVWKRLQTIWGYYDAADSLGFAHGRGTLQGQPPEASHCTHIGPIHRAMIHPLLARWFDIRLAGGEEYKGRRETKELVCLTPAVAKELQPKSLCDLLTAQVAASAAQRKEKLAGRTPTAEELRAAWQIVLGQTEPRTSVQSLDRGDSALPAGVKCRRLIVTVQKTDLQEVAKSVRKPSAHFLDTPALLLLPGEQKGKCGLVVCLAAGGKREFLKQRSKEIARLLSAGLAVGLPDLRGMGETIDDPGRGPGSSATSYSSSELMLGETHLGGQLRELRTVLSEIGQVHEIDRARIAVWGESFAPPLAADAEYRVPRRFDPRPRESEPGPALLAELALLFDESLAGGAAIGGLADFAAPLQSPFVYAPHDFLVPGLAVQTDHASLAAAVARSAEGKTERLLVARQVDGVNRLLRPHEPPPDVVGFLLARLRAK